MPTASASPHHVQKPFRCSSTLEVRLNKAKGALMLKTGERITDNQFILMLIEMGLTMLREKMDLSLSEKG